MNLLDKIRTLVRETEAYCARAKDPQEKMRINATGFIEIRDCLNEAEGVGPGDTVTFHRIIDELD